MSKARPLNVLIGCECSGVVREAFRRRGHNAYSCDVKPAEDGSSWHIQDDLRIALRSGTPTLHTCEGASWEDGTTGVGWDLLIAHPPCTYLCNSGVRWFTTIPAKPKPGVLYGEARREGMREAARFYADLLTCDIRHKAIENPTMHKYARAALLEYLRECDPRTSASAAIPDQIIQPWQFGHGETKATGLWLAGGLPKLQPSQIVEGRAGNVHRMVPSPTRAADRARTYRGIAEAMADQWGRFVQERIK